MAPLRYAAKLDPFLSLDCSPTPSTLAQSKERKGSNFAIRQPYPQTGDPPARLVLDGDTVAPGRPLKFRIEGGGFKGFMVQARVDPEENTPVGL